MRDEQALCVGADALPAELGKEQHSDLEARADRPARRERAPVDESDERVVVDRDGEHPAVGAEEAVLLPLLPARVWIVVARPLERFARPGVDVEAAHRVEITL